MYSPGLKFMVTVKTLFFSEWKSIPSESVLREDDGSWEVRSTTDTNRGRFYKSFTLVFYESSYCLPNWKQYLHL